MRLHSCWHGFLFAAASCLLPAAAQAATITVYNSRPVFLAAIGASQTFDFNAPDNTVVAALDGLASVSTVGGDGIGRTLTNTLCGSTGAVDCFPPVLFTFLAAGRAFGYDNGDFTVHEEAVFRVTFSNGDPSQTFVFDLNGAPSFTPIFFGVRSDVDIASVMIYSRDPGTNEVGQRANTIDNVTLQQVAIPEPSSLVLIGLGLAGGLRRWRRR